MTTINSLDEFLQALDDNPAWRDAVRARILGNEVLQLPARFNAFMERQQEFNERVTIFMERQQEFNERVTVFMERTEARMVRIESDISVTKGGHVRTLLADLLPDLAETLGFDLIGAMAPPGNHPNRPQNIQRHPARTQQLPPGRPGRPSRQGPGNHPPRN